MNDIEHGEYLSYSPIIYYEKDFWKLKDIPTLDDGQLYIYVMLNSEGNIKIGKTTNIAQRLQSLSGSNGGGSKIVKLYVSPSSWLQSIESTCHNHYEWYRIKGTEWFKGKDLVYEEVVEWVNALFYSHGYETCNNLRKKIFEEKKDK